MFALDIRCAIIDHRGLVKHFAGSRRRNQDRAVLRWVSTLLRIVECSVCSKIVYEAQILRRTRVFRAILNSLVLWNSSVSDKNWLVHVGSLVVMVRSTIVCFGLFVPCV